jgi:hypothetical protein
MGSPYASVAEIPAGRLRDRTGTAWSARRRAAWRGQASTIAGEPFGRPRENCREVFLSLVRACKWEARLRGYQLTPLVQQIRG